MEGSNPIQIKCISAREVSSSGSDAISTSNDMPSNRENKEAMTTVKISEKSQPNSHGGNRRRSKMFPTTKRNSDEISARVDIPSSSDDMIKRYQQCLTNSVDTSLVGRHEHETIVYNIKPIGKSNNSWEDCCELVSKLVEIDNMKKMHDTRKYVCPRCRFLPFYAR